MPDTTQLTLTLADVVTALQADLSLAPTRRRDLCSAVRRVAGMLARDPARLPASLPEIRRALAPDPRLPSALTSHAPGAR